jgi:hypothetical protein
LEFLSNLVSKMNFLGGDRGSKRLIFQNTLLKIVSKKYGLMLRAVESKFQIGCFVKIFVKTFNILGILAYELPNRILILKKSDDFFFLDFFLFF